MPTTPTGILSRRLRSTSSITRVCVFHSLPLIQGRRIHLGGRLGRPVRSRKAESTSDGAPSHNQRLMVGSDSLGSRAASTQRRTAFALPPSNHGRRDASTTKHQLTRLI